MLAFSPPYDRGELAMIRQAARNRWQVPRQNKAAIVREVQRLLADDRTPAHVRESAKATWEIIQAAGWVQ